MKIANDSRDLPWVSTGESSRVTSKIAVSLWVSGAFRKISIPSYRGRVTFSSERTAGTIPNFRFADYFFPFGSTQHP
jgi:hypothetical protein